MYAKLKKPNKMKLKADKDNRASNTFNYLGIRKISNDILENEMRTY